MTKPKTKAQRERKGKSVPKKILGASKHKPTPRPCPACGGSGFVGKCACCGSPIPYGKSKGVR